MNSSGSAKSAGRGAGSASNTAVSSSAGKKNEVITIDLCLSDTDDEQQHEPSAQKSAASSAGLKRHSGSRSNKKKGKRPKPDPSGFDSPGTGSGDNSEIIVIDDDDDDEAPAAAAFASSSASASASTTSGASKSFSTSQRKLTGRMVTKVEAGSNGSKSTNNGDDDDEVELVDGASSSSSGWRQVSATAAASAGPENRANGSTVAASSLVANSSAASAASASASASARTGQPKDDRAYESNADDDDEEFELVTTKGTNALIDFPHSRENCVQFSFANGDKKAHCDNCYCYVCDIPAKDCKSWDAHCKASHGDRRWRDERERFKRLGVDAASAAPAPCPAAPGPARAAPSASAGRSMSASSSGASSAGWRSHLGGARYGGTQRAQIDPIAYVNRPNLPQYSVAALLDKLTVVHPVEATPPRSRFVTKLRHYQKQSLAFMREVERSPGPSVFKDDNRGGFLCDQVGMGKSAVVLALVASSVPSQVVSSHEEVKAQNRLIRLRQSERIQRCNMPWKEAHNFKFTPIIQKKLKATVITTSVSLLGQWEDECRKHAPELVVKVAHPSRHPRDPSTFQYFQTKDLHKVDIILTTSTFYWGDRCSGFLDAFSFHRVVADESHLFGTASARLDNAYLLSSNRRWCVTATPCTGSVGELYNQLQFLGGGMHGFADRFFDIGNNKIMFYWLLDSLKPIMIRHTKSQRINGSEALALPPSSTTTTLVSMSADEKRRLRENFKSHLIASYRRSGGEKTFPLSRALGLLSGYGCRSKITLLCNDLQALRLKEPSLRAVVFTQSLETHKEIINVVQRSGFEVLQFSGPTDAKKRDESIRKFQAKSPRPAVFVITMRAGNVGITLTAASRVYLMEPCLDPAVEVQAAGRIHRLGQTKPVHVVRYAFKNSPEHNITKLHTEIVAGKVSITDGFVPSQAIKVLAEGL